MKKFLVSLILLVFMTVNSFGWGVQMYWDANPPAENVVSYNVYRSLTSGSGYAVIGSVPAASNPTFTDSGIAAGTGPYFYVVTAVNIGGLESGFSNELQVDEAAAGVPPSNPTIQILIVTQ